MTTIRIKTEKCLLLLINILLLSCYNKTEIETSCFKTKTGWGYAIYENKKIIIKQNIIPAIDTQKSFKTKQDALLIAKLIATKLSNNQSPTITQKELKLLHIDTK